MTVSFHDHTVPVSSASPAAASGGGGALTEPGMSGAPGSVAAQAAITSATKRTETTGRRRIDGSRVWRRLRVILAFDACAFRAILVVIVRASAAKADARPRGCRPRRGSPRLPRSFGMAALAEEGDPDRAAMPGRGAPVPERSSLSPDRAAGAAGIRAAWRLAHRPTRDSTAI